MNNTSLAGWEEEGVLEGVLPLLYAVVDIGPTNAYFQTYSLWSNPSLSVMNNMSLAGWEEERELEAVPPLLYAVVNIWAYLCIFSE